MVTVIGAATPVFAHEGEHAGSDGHGGLIRRVNETVRSTTAKVEDTVVATEDNVDKAKDRLMSQRDRIENRKAELEDQMKQKLEDRKQKLDGRRLAQCQNRQANINTLIDRSVDVGRERLAHIQRVEEGVKAFYEKQGLSSEGYQTAVDDVDAKEAAAIAALDVIAASDFDCTKIDGAAPSDSIRSSHQAKKAALDAYRASVKELIKVVKDAFADKAASAEDRS